MQPALFEDDRIRQLGQATIGYRRSASILNRGVGNLKGVDFTLNPYVGCQFGCSYCYAAFFQPDPERVASWGQWVEAKENAATLVRRAGDRLAGKRIVIGSATDPYQPLEAKFRLTRSVLEELLNLRPTPDVVLFTRSPLVVADVDVLSRFPNARVQMTVTTDDDAVRKAFEPGCPSIGRRVEAIVKLAEAGIRVTASVAPILPIRDVATFVRTLATAGAKRTWASPFHDSDRPFAAGTGKAAREIALEMGWTKERAEAAAVEVRREASLIGLA
ncbi:MAG TPA: radical SAM protein [Fimbriimonadaceae bacterium]|nr:radical SAM protein [Fimbriimonadaceae bacterium]